MMQTMCSRNTGCVCDGSCDDPGCMAKHPPQVTFSCGNCGRLARKNAELRDQISGLEDAHLAEYTRAERAESELAALRKRVGDAPVVEWSRYFDYDESSLVGKRVRLVEESV